MPETKTKTQIEQRVTDALIEFGEDHEAISLTTRLEDLEVDSLDLVELAQIVEDEYGVEISDNEMEKLKTVGDVVDLIAERA